MVMRVTELGVMLGETVSTVKRASFLLVLYILMLAVAAPAAAQKPNPDCCHISYLCTVKHQR